MSQQFKNRKLLIATMHQKEKVIAPLLEKEFGVKCFVLKNFDTDKFGTFTREIKRKGDMYETIKAKLNTAMKIADCDLGVASEGSFGLHPAIPFAQSGLELLLLIDKKNNLEIRGHHLSSEINLGGEYIHNLNEAIVFAKKYNFPKHNIIVRKTKDGKKNIYKNIQTLNNFKQKVTVLLKSPNISKVFLETDMRAHKNPTRMSGITLATQDLIKNIKSACPQCKTPGFIITNVEKGLLCSLCSSSTDLPIFEIFSCANCNYQKKVKIVKYGKTADPEQCGNCNP